MPRGGRAPSPRAWHLTSREGKKDLFDVGTGKRGARSQLVERSLSDDGAVAEQHEAFADTRRVVKLVDRQQQRPSGGGNASQQRADVSYLTQIETVEGL